VELQPLRKLIAFGDMQIGSNRFGRKLGIGGGSERSAERRALPSIATPSA